MFTLAIDSNIRDVRAWLAGLPRRLPDAMAACLQSPDLAALARAYAQMDVALSVYDIPESLAYRRTFALMRGVESAGQDGELHVFIAQKPDNMAKQAPHTITYAQFFLDPEALHSFLPESTERKRPFMDLWVNSIPQLALEKVNKALDAELVK